MASQPRSGSQQINPYLSPNQQDLLLAALNSQAASKQASSTKASSTSEHSLVKRSDSSESQNQHTNPNDTMFQSPDNFGDFTPGLDYLDGDNSFDFDNADLGGEMIGALPGNGVPEQHEKRKSPDENGSPEEGDAKRQETQEGEKGSKKPGRKPLTSEPTTVSLAFSLSQCAELVRSMLGLVFRVENTVAMFSRFVLSQRSSRRLSRRPASSIITLCLD